jgi:hypothetical protein
VSEVPTGTALVAKAAFPKGSLAIRVRDELRGLFHDDLFADLFPPSWTPRAFAGDAPFLPGPQPASSRRPSADGLHPCACRNSGTQPLKLAAETLRCALNALAAAAPDWVQGWITPEWFDRYGRRAEDYRLPRGVQARINLAAEFGSDGMELLKRVYSPSTLAWLRELPAGQTLWQLWIQQFHIVDEVVRWLTAKDLPTTGTARLTTPYDLQVMGIPGNGSGRSSVKAQVSDRKTPSAPRCP